MNKNIKNLLKYSFIWGSNVVTIELTELLAFSATFVNSPLDGKDETESFIQPNKFDPPWVIGDKADETGSGFNVKLSKFDGLAFKEVSLLGGIAAVNVVGINGSTASV